MRNLIRTTLKSLRRAVKMAIVANIVVWVVTAWTAFVFGCPYFLLLIGPGEIQIVMHAQTAKATIGLGVSWDFFSWKPHRIPSEWFHLPHFGSYISSIPFWLTLLLLIGVNFLLGRWHSRSLLGSCLHCEYDLQGNESGVCPECGEAVEVAA